MSPTARYSTDPRVDRALTWGLTAFAGLALTVGAYFFRDLSGTVKELSNAVAGLKTEVAVLRVERREIERLEREVAELRSKQQETSARVVALERSR